MHLGHEKNIMRTQPLTTDGRRRALVVLWKQVVVAALSVVCATLIRSGLQDPIDTHSSYMLYIAAVLATAAVAGWKAAIVSAGMGAVAAHFQFVQPNLGWRQPMGGFLDLAFYLIACVFAVLACLSLERTRRSEQRAIWESNARLEALGVEMKQRDIAEAALQLRDKRMALLMRHAGVAVCELDEKGLVRFANDDFGALVGDSGLMCVGQPFANYLKNEEILGRIWDSIQTGQLVIDSELALSSVDGAVRVCSISAIPSIVEDGSRRIALYMRDISDRKLAEAHARDLRATLLEFQANERIRIESELERVQGQLVRQTSLVAIGHLSASIAHDLRNPLGVIRNAAYLLRRRMAREGENLELIAMIDDEVKTADAIITNLMEMTRARPPACAEVNLRRLVDEVGRRIDTSGRMRWRADAIADSLLIWCDVAQFRQVLFNLMRNSAEAMKGEGEVAFFARELERETLVEIRDGGPGISEHIRNRLFDPLVTDKTAGTGLGLLTCRQIVERHGGTIQLLDSGANGTTFQVRLPRPSRPEATLGVSSD